MVQFVQCFSTTTKLLNLTFYIVPKYIRSNFCSQLGTNHNTYTYLIRLLATLTISIPPSTLTIRWNNNDNNAWSLPPATERIGLGFPKSGADDAKKFISRWVTHIHRTWQKKSMEWAGVICIAHDPYVPCGWFDSFHTFLCQLVRGYYII